MWTRRQLLTRGLERTHSARWRSVRVDSRTAGRHVGEETSTLFVLPSARYQTRLNMDRTELAAGGGRGCPHTNITTPDNQFSTIGHRNVFLWWIGCGHLSRLELDFKASTLHMDVTNYDGN